MKHKCIYVLKSEIKMTDEQKEKQNNNKKKK